MHSYRTELAGILAILLAIRAVLSESTNSQITGTVYCDNMRAVQRLNELDRNYPNTVKEANEEEHEHLFEINEQRKQLPTINLEWVKGHVRHPTNLAEHLNGRADTLAKDNRLRGRSHRGGGIAQRLPHQVATAVFGGTSYHGQLPEAAKRHVYGIEAESYIEEKFNITANAMTDVDWESIRRMTKGLPLRQRANKAKFTYRWNYTKTRGYLFNEEPHETCPLCGTEPETNKHILRCGCEEMVEERTRLTEKFKEEQIKIGTHQAMTRIMIQLLQDTEEEMRHHGHRIDADGLGTLRVRQRNIGYGNFESGWWTTAWKEQHDQMRRRGHRSRYSGDKWAPRAMKIVWDYIDGQWNFRNGLIHGANEEEQHEIERERLEQKASDLYDDRPDVGKRKALFTPTKEQILRKNILHLKTWIGNVEIAAKAEEHRRKREKRSKKTIRYWLVARQRHKRQRVEEPIDQESTIEAVTERMKQLTLKDTG